MQVKKKKKKNQNYMAILVAREEGERGEGRRMANSEVV